MKRFFLISAALLMTVVAVAQQAWLSPPVTGVNKQQPRTALISYPTQELALAGDTGDNTYRQVITKWDTQSGVMRASFKMPFLWADREVFLRVPVSTASFSVKVNGSDAGYSQSPRGNAEFDITRFCTEGNNELEITIHSDAASKVIEQYPASGAPLQGVCVFSQPKLRIRDVALDATLDYGVGQLTVGVVMATHWLNTKQVRIRYQLLDPEGKSIADGYRDETFSMRGQDTINFFVRVDDVEAWSPEHPALYAVLLKVQQEGRYTEYMTVKAGFRTIGYEGGQILINGQTMKVSMEQFTPSGDLAADRAAIVKLKERGINTLILPAPQTEEFYAMCDRTGIWICPTACINSSAAGQSREKGGNPSNDPAWEAAYTDRALTAYHTSKIHPSALMFRLADGQSANGYNLYESYIALKKIEPVRPIIYPATGKEWNNDPIKQ